ncbi:MAG: hypothetical protein GAK35_02207 [Herbaspirillum frisingense]|uniref:Uncharacterized protein n=1 Tax=Herbaspirillum frisingense TaxID=92645 RepID=A0A7V8FWM0_9BURK|nr:MAG: hypothetical protein GAK35_02207 [Herbaspirillum frisingense]
MLDNIPTASPTVNATVAGGGMAWTHMHLPWADMVSIATFCWVLLQIAALLPKVLKIFRNWKAGKGWSDE